jgi:hypothetical protein
MASEVPLKDIAIAVIGGGAAIAAVLLVFVAFLFTKADSLPPETPNSTIEKYARTAKAGFVPLVMQVIAVAAAYEWLFYMDSWQLMMVWKYGFPIALLVFVVYAAAVLWML